MKIKKFTSALVAMGVLSLAIAAQATQSSTNVIYFTGSTAARAFIFNALTNVGSVFDSGFGGKIISGSPNNANSSQFIVFEGPINGTVVDIDCDWSGSEASI